MATPNWPLFGAVVLLLTLALLVLSRMSARLLSAEPRADTAPTSEGEGEEGGDAGRIPVPTGGALLANVGLTHGLLGVVLLLLVWFASIPLEAIGVAPVSADVLATGLGLGVGLYLASEAATAIADRASIEYDERLRESLAPERPADWALLLLVVLPLIAGAEELLFRGILVGALSTGFGLPVWGLVLVSSVLFGLGHSAQGVVGITVTAALGLVIGGAFVLTGSLAVVVLAHYAVDALEFVVREGVFD